MKALILCMTILTANLLAKSQMQIPIPNEIPIQVTCPVCQEVYFHTGPHKCKK